jgi:diadenosine tetraphosphatase ApaH/serine/threonine PP2A family protein phosphatase
MRVLIISDIHANLAALEAVLTDASEVEAVWCLGDLVGYGPDPNECIRRVEALPGLQCILGNHDAAALGQIDTDTFNPEARRALLWTQDSLDAGSLAFLRALPEKIETGLVTLAHGSPRQPVWEYLLDTHSATRSFEYFQTSFCFVGHTHLPVVFHLARDRRYARLWVPDTVQQLPLTPRAIINPGSVGQPRDRDPRAAYAIFSTEDQVWEFRRVAYDIAAVQERMKRAHLPERHAARLAGGW